MKSLTVDEKVKLAGVMYNYISGIQHLRNQVLEGFAEMFQTSEYYAKELLSGRRNLREIQADWVIEQIWGMVSVKKLREFFYALVEDSPDAYGYDVPVYEILQMDEKTPETLRFERWKNKKLLKRSEPETV